MWYAVLPAQGGPQLPPQHQYPRAGEDATGRAWFPTRETVWAWRQRRRVQVVFHPDAGVLAPGRQPRGR